MEIDIYTEQARENLATQLQRMKHERDKWEDKYKAHLKWDHKGKRLRKVVFNTAGVVFALSLIAWFIVAVAAWTPAPSDSELWLVRGAMAMILSFVLAITSFLIADE